MFWTFFVDLCISVGKKPNTVCRELGFSSATATHWKNNSIPNGDALIKIADYFGVSIDFLVGRQNNGPIKKEITPNAIRSVIVNRIESLSDHQAELVLFFLNVLQEESSNNSSNIQVSSGCIHV